MEKMDFKHRKQIVAIASLSAQWSSLRLKKEVEVVNSMTPTHFKNVTLSIDSHCPYCRSARRMPALSMNRLSKKIEVKIQVVMGSKGIWPAGKAIGGNQHMSDKFERDLHFCLPIIFK
jgi:hypothetical protein